MKLPEIHETVRVERGTRGEVRLEVDALVIEVVAGPDRGLRKTVPFARLKVGKAPGCGLVLSDPAVSSEHAEVVYSEAGVRLQDLDSTNGTWLGGTRLTEATLAPGAEVRMGESVLRFGRDRAEVRSETRAEASFHGLVGVSPAMREVYGLLRAVAATGASVLLTGESGTGKEVAARAVHAASGRTGPFVVFDAAATDPEMVRSQLFGHIKGAFTGAAGARAGAFREAEGGTLFLDELGELPLDLQPRLLRALERREVLPVGSDRPVPVDVRVVAATHRDLPAMVDAGNFRGDLFHRLAVFPVELPSLRERPEDLPALIDKLAAAGGWTLSLTPEAEAALAAHPWPGNARELRNVLERAAILARGRPATPDDLRLSPGAAAPSPAATPTTPVTREAPAAPETLEQAERRLIQAALARHGGDRVQAAEELGISERTLRRRLAAWGET
jgi:DNA-binding NtrC family response regulator